MLNLASFWKGEACGQTVLPDRSILIWQKLAKNAKIEKFKWDILVDFQTMWRRPLVVILSKIDLLLLFSQRYKPKSCQNPGLKIIWKKFLSYKQMAPQAPPKPSNYMVSQRIHK